MTPDDTPTIRLLRLGIDRRGRLSGSMLPANHPDTIIHPDTQQPRGEAPSTDPTAPPRQRADISLRPESKRPCTPSGGQE